MRPSSPTSRPARRPGFTITEMLVTVGVIVILASILVIALSSATRSSQRAKTGQLMNSIKTAIARFKTDQGYLPPVLGPGATPADSIGHGRDLLAPPFGASGAGTLQNDDYREVQAYFSLTSLPEYLLGYGDRRFDGYGFVATNSQPIPPLLANNDPGSPGYQQGYKEYPSLGFRSPGLDGYWNATLNPRFAEGVVDPNRNGVAFPDRNPDDLGIASFTGGNLTTMPGRVYGPYLDVSDPTVLGEVRGLSISDEGGNGVRQEWERVLLPGDGDYGQGVPPKVFLDYWGNPIRFYARPPRDLRAPGVLDDRYTLADVVALRPQSFAVGSTSESAWADANGDTSTSRALLAAEYALFTPGADGRNDDERRIDVEGYNLDNLVEVGP
ncbi:MAG: type II secretion system protein [Planctomycetota bacterium]|nr:type II secretion system protein [Planctomycetota bacterium]MEC9157267.1 type II secretion system protein [Planctomycetota bacterium]MED5507358.1 type II secretion system protein [Planctomycetota bacterium]